ncbi:iron reductase [Leisingera sp. ANG-M1]|uniref:sulfite oxidase heme-binding subunit YedZ n=1 Tax=Leisingera sp. ANG-M1 TaxID=1577895 RepID=UPI00057E3057|nr:ferric reductase-like transmembrane domain-containing protein [Leisingera sp. ANG-M1]KIC11202.1 iron reductase [Leisingera sp. ANG-M1]
MPRYAAFRLWFILSLPAVLIAFKAGMSSDPQIFRALAHPAAEFSARLMILAMMATPLMLLFKGHEAPRWLCKNRRALGVSAFLYAAIHVLFYLIDRASWAVVTADLSKTYILAGWLGFAILLPLAATSCDYCVRRMGPRWKKLQRWAHPAALLVLLHWAAIYDWAHPFEAFLHFTPLLFLQGHRIWYWYLRPRPVRRQSEGF